MDRKDVIMAIDKYLSGNKGDDLYDIFARASASLDLTVVNVSEFMYWLICVENPKFHESTDLRDLVTNLRDCLAQGNEMPNDYIASYLRDNPELHSVVVNINREQLSYFWIVLPVLLLCVFVIIWLIVMA